jgi:hypothetical protein
VKSRERKGSFAIHLQVSVGAAFLSNRLSQLSSLRCVLPCIGNIKPEGESPEQGMRAVRLIISIGNA